jgi:hypothetical protein
VAAEVFALLEELLRVAAVVMAVLAAPEVVEQVDIVEMVALALVVALLANLEQVAVAAAAVLYVFVIYVIVCLMALGVAALVSMVKVVTDLGDQKDCGMLDVLILIQYREVAAEVEDHQVELLHLLAQHLPPALVVRMVVVEVDTAALVVIRRFHMEQEQEAQSVLFGRVTLADSHQLV